MRKRAATTRPTPEEREADARAERWLEELLRRGERATSQQPRDDPARRRRKSALTSTQ
jgi:hypothetical protein